MVSRLSMEHSMNDEIIANENSELRPLTGAEMDEASGGILPLLLGALAFEAGFLGGVIAANYHYTGNFWGDID
jgi:hypothetical protein